jgi:hypothetical protein
VDCGLSPVAWLSGISDAEDSSLYEKNCEGQESGIVTAGSLCAGFWFVNI